MANSSIDLLSGEEARESSRVKVKVLRGNGNPSLPDEALRTREQVL